MRNSLMSFIVAAACVAWLAPAAASQEKATEVGASTCAGCHAEQAESFKKSGHAKKLLAVKKIDFEKSCESCHGAGSLHAAAGGDKSNAGFATIKKPSEMTAEASAAQCLSCHKSTKQVMMWGTSLHKTGGVSCVKCHSVHQGEGKFQLAKDPVETCLSCHKKERGQIQLASHHPLTEGKMTCSGCHNPHGGIEGNLVGESLEDTCFKCHPNKAGPFAGEHPPVAESCAMCHKPHGSPNEYMLKQAQPFLCLRCHKQPHVATLSTSTAARRALRDTNSNETVTYVETRGRCTDCHRDIHGSDRSGSLKR